VLLSAIRVCQAISKASLDGLCAQRAWQALLPVLLPRLRARRVQLVDLPMSLQSSIVYCASQALTKTKQVRRCAKLVPREVFPSMQARKRALCVLLESSRILLGKQLAWIASKVCSSQCLVQDFVTIAWRAPLLQLVESHFVIHALLGALLMYLV
jgi:hypothetical protein